MSRLPARWLGATFVLALAASAIADEGALELTFGREGDRSAFRVLGKLQVPRGTLVSVGLVFEGRVIPGTWRRLELGADGILRQTWDTKPPCRVLAGEYDVVATIDSSRQVRALRSAFPGPARQLRASVYVDQPEDALADEAVVREKLLKESQALVALAQETAGWAPLTSSAPAAAKTDRRMRYDRASAELDALLGTVSARVPPAVLAARDADLQESVASLLRCFRETLTVQAWREVDGALLDAPSFITGTPRRTSAFLTAREVVREGERLQRELEHAHKSGVRGPRGLDRVVRLGREALAETARASTDERLRRAKEQRFVAALRDLAADAAGAGLAGGKEELLGLARDMDELATKGDPEKKLAARIRERFAALEGRLGQEKAKRKGELDEITAELAGLEAQLAKLRAAASREGRDEWREKLAALHKRIVALPDRSAELFPGARAELELVVRALAARDLRESEPDQGSYLDRIVREALARLRSAL